MGRSRQGGIGWDEDWMAKKENEKAEDGAVAESADGPLLDLSDAAVKRMIKAAKKRGFVTYAELNAVLPSEEVNSEQIEDILAMLNEMGINVVEAEEADDGEGRGKGRRGGGRRRRPRRGGAPKAVATRTPSRPTARTIPCACTCARWARWSCCRARARSPSPSASRPAARR